ncbi:MAG: energy transducer TonB [Gammaproteobacteria bacterium]|nr:energy transducer TonB [Gammaproteobacteria bacterium]
MEKLLEPDRFITWNQPSRQKWPVAGLVVAAHLLVVYGLWQAQKGEVFQEEEPMFVSLIESAIQQEEARPVLPQVVPRPAVAVPTPDLPKPIVTEAPAAAAEVVVPTSPMPVAEPVLAAPEPMPIPVPMPMSSQAQAPVSQTVSLPELAAVCSERVPPVYPWRAKKMGLQGRVVLQVGLDDVGRITQAAVHQSSGVTLLDEAALAAVQQWRCQPAMSNGRAVPAVALQPFNFTLKRG